MGKHRNKLALIVFLVSVSSVMGYEDMGDMANALKQLMKQNQQLQKQMSTITAGLTEMCRAVNIATCDCDQARETESHVVDDMQELKLLTLESHGEQNDSVQLTLKFEATDDYSVHWWQTFMHGNGMRTHGLLEKTDLFNNRYMYTSTLHLHDIRLTRLVIAQIYSLRYSASILVNLDAIGVKGEQMIPEWKYKITKYPRQLILPNDLDDEYNVTVNVERNILELVEEGHSGFGDLRLGRYIILVNTTSEPNTAIEMYDHDYIRVSYNDNGIGDIEVVFTMLKEYLDNGGLFTFTLPHVGEGYIQAVNYGVVIEIVREYYMSVAPPGSIAVDRVAENIYAAASVVSVSCSAMGNPAPNVTIHEEWNGQMKPLQTQTLLKDKVTHSAYVTLNALTKKGHTSIGTYICQISNGNVTIEKKINVQRYQSIEFDERKTGVTVNTTKKVVVTCKAFGNPTPVLEMRLGSVNGPDLLQAKGNFTSTVKTKVGWTKVTISFSPPDPRIDTLYCKALQRELYDFDQRIIEVFPETADATYKWSLLFP